MITRSISVAALLREKRIAAGITQEELSEKMGLTQKRKSYQQISNIERGVCQLPIKHVAKISEVLGVTKETIIDLLVQDYKQKIISHICHNISTDHR